MSSVAGMTATRQADWVQCANRCGVYIDSPGICAECEHRYGLQSAASKSHAIILPTPTRDDPLYIQVYGELQDQGLIAKWDIVNAQLIAENVHRSAKSVRTALNQLYSKGWIEKRRHGIQNEYRLAVYSPA